MIAAALATARRGGYNRKKETMKKLVAAALLGGCLILGTATAAFAHSSHVTHHEICSDGATKTVVTFDNDYTLAAKVTYHWGSDSASTADLAKKTGSNPTVSLPSHNVGTLTYHVVWTDNFRQPSQGDTTLTIAPLGNCHPTTTTSTSTTTTTTRPTTTTTTKPTTTTTASTTTTTQLPTTTSSTTTNSTTTNSTKPTTTTTAQAEIVRTQVLGETLVRPGVVGPTPLGGVQTGGGGMSHRSNHLLPLGVGLGGVAVVTFVTTRLRRRAG